VQGAQVSVMDPIFHMVGDPLAGMNIFNMPLLCLRNRPTAHATNTFKSDLNLLVVHMIVYPFMF
jgi:hypothetical protein